MKLRTRTATSVVAWTAAAVLGVALAAGVAQAKTGGSGAQPAAAAAAAAPKAADADRRRGPLDRLGHRALHAEAVVRTKHGGFATVDVQKGLVTAVSTTSLTVRSADGFTATYVRTAATRVRAGKPAAGATTPVTPLAAGQSVEVLATRADGQLTARAVRVRPAAPVRSGA